MEARGWVLMGMAIGVLADFAIRGILGGSMIVQAAGAIILVVVAGFLLLLIIP